MAGLIPERWTERDVTGRGPFSPRQMLELDACTRCGECLRACDSFRVKGDESVALMGMIHRRRRLHNQEESFVGRLLHPNGASERDWDEFEAGVFSCTLCGRCEQFCPVGIKTRTLALTMRQELAGARCKMPKNLGIAREAVLEEGNVFQFPNEDRAMWAEFMDELPDGLLGKEKAEVLYFVGCVSSFSPAVQEVPQAFLSVLLKANVDVALLAGEEWCCGFPLIVGGLAADAQKMIDHNTERLRSLGAKTVVFNCPSCYYTWSNYYPLEDVRLLHSSQFIRELVEAGRITFDDCDLPVTYHDPCDLGRGMGEYAAPRDVLKSFAGDNYVELSPSGSRALCCGGGGDVEMWDPDLVGAINGELTDAVERSGAKLVVQACPQCKRVTQRSLEERKSEIRTLDITEFALEFGKFRDESS